MQRRRFLSGLVALAAGAIGAGCTSNAEVPVTAPEAPVGGSDPGTGPDSEPGTDPGSDAETTAGEPVSLEGFDTGADSDGLFFVRVTVANDTDRELTAYVAVTAQVDGDSYERGRYAPLSPAGTATVRILFPFSRERFLDSGDVSLEVTQRTPETPLPTATESGSGVGTGTDETPGRGATGTRTAPASSATDARTAASNATDTRTEPSGTDD